jgi:two-component system KDP operon response regulator KdpE
MQEQPRILVVDDDARFVRVLRVNLETRGYKVSVAFDGPSALAMADAWAPDLVILDLRMPGMDGYEVCQRIRAYSSVPIIMLTGLAQESDKVKGLDAGADDYLIKPFNVEELLARVRAALRRRGQVLQPHSLPVFRSGDLLVDFDLERVFVKGREVDLTAAEYQVLCVLIRNRGRMVPTEHLLEVLRQEGVVPTDAQLQPIILRLRAMLEPDPENPKYIVSHEGVGYGFQVSG